MTEKTIGTLIRCLAAEGCAEGAVVSLDEILAAVAPNEDRTYLANLIESLERSNFLRVKYKKDGEYLIELLPKSNLFLKEKEEESAAEKEIKITIPAKKIFLWSFLGALLASAIVAALAILTVKLL